VLTGKGVYYGKSVLDIEENANECDASSGRAKQRFPVSAEAPCQFRFAKP
jgi:hypothetical protein